MELFNLTRREVSDLRDSTLDRLIQFNRELKINYSNIKESELHYKEAMPDRLKQISQSKSTSPRILKPFS